MASVKLLVGGVSVWVARDSVVRLCPPETTDILTVRVGGVDLVCDRGIFQEGGECILSPASRFYAGQDTVEIPDAEAELFPLLFDYLRRSAGGGEVCLQTSNISVAQAKQLDALLEGLMPGFERNTFPIAGDDVLVALHGQYGSELPVEASRDPVVVGLVQSLDASWSARDSERIQQIYHEQLQKHLQEEHGYDFYRRGVNSSFSSGCPIYVDRVPRGTLFTIEAYDGCQNVMKLDTDSFFAA